MANWSRSTLTVSGDTDELTRLEDDFPRFALGAVLPRPDALRGIQIGRMIGDAGVHRAWREHVVGSEKTQVPLTDAEAAALIDHYGATNLLDWSRQHWGTKSEVDANTWTRTEGGLAVHLDTADGPPAPVVLELSRRYPGLVFAMVYDIEVIGEGRFSCRAGEVLEDAFEEYDWDAFHEANGLKASPSHEDRA